MPPLDDVHLVLRRLLTGTPEIEACAYFTEDGVQLAAAIPAELKEVEVGAVAATLMALAQQAADDLKRGSLNQVLLRGARGYASLSSDGTGGLLVVLATPQARLGLLFFDLERAMAQIVALNNDGHPSPSLRHP